MTVAGPAGRGRPMRKGRGLLDRQAIVAAALAVARTEGLSAVTMRRIADALGCGPMSLYRHVARRDALLPVLPLVAEGLASPRILPVIDRAFSALMRSGLSGRSRVAVHQMLWQYVFGELLWTHHDRPDSYGKRMVRGAPPDAFPAIADAVRS